MTGIRLLLTKFEYLGKQFRVSTIYEPNYDRIETLVLEPSDFASLDEFSWGETLPNIRKAVEGHDVLVERLKRILNMSIEEEADLSIPSKFILANAGIRTVGELSFKSEEEILSCRNARKSNLREITKFLGELGIMLHEKPISDEDLAEEE